MNEVAVTVRAHDQAGGRVRIVLALFLFVCESDQVGGRYAGVCSVDVRSLQQ